MYHKLQVMGEIVSQKLESTFLRVDIKLSTKKEDKVYPCILYKDKFTDLATLQQKMVTGKIAVIAGTPITKKEGKTVITGINVTEYPSIESEERIYLVGRIGKASIDTNSQTQERFIHIKLVVKPYKDKDKQGNQNEYWYTLFINSKVVNIDKVFAKLDKNKLLYVVGVPHNKVIMWNEQEIVQRGCIVTEMPLFLS